ncbi:amino acid permease [Rhodohalobacter sp.]|uniref:amino acid permease n=1 Tax=Rhodohalobacter sp. TaxID=1974210 RepID=UPI002ACEE68B|nr:amino acid permease [Rhodohalobacter sp.]MDZ7756527.1 amino acid permease [Rhodohalobacter sp.]
MAEKKQPLKKKFGTFLGVYLPSTLTVLGLIMYLRFGWVVGNLGLSLTIFIVILANVITFITGLSAAAIATNIKVGVGGVYYLISRSLGLETGGAIGVAFFISRTLSITFYAFGLSELLLLFWPVEMWGTMPAYAIPLVTAAIIILITLVSGKSADLVLKFQIPMLILVVLSILALMAGVFLNELRMPELSPEYRTVSPDGGLWIVFAVFFPGVTGFLAGIAMSGDLKTPGISIKDGTIYSVFTGLGVYLLIPVLLSISAAVSLENMADESYGLQTWIDIAFLGGLFIYPAACGAILSSAIGSVLSGPRVLQSLSIDGLAPKFLSKVSKTGQPTIATWITGAIALAAVALGDLNTVAKFVTVLFLTLYVIINLVATIENLVAEPSYRPSVKIPWYVSLIGALGSLFVMYLISLPALILAFLLEAGFYLYFKKKALEQQWGDVNAGMWMKIARFSLLRMNIYNVQKRNWRPIMLLFAKNIKDRIELVKLAAAFGQDRGILSISKLVFRSDRPDRKERKRMKEEMIREVNSFGLETFCEVNEVEDLNSGILNISKGHGIAGLKTNTIMFGWSDSLSDNINQLRIIRSLSQIGKNIVVANFNDHENWKVSSHQKIDVWWGGTDNNGDLMILLAYMLTLNPEWQQARINIREVIDHPGQQTTISEGITRSLKEARIEADIEVIVKQGRSFPEILKDYSSDSDIVMLGLKYSEGGEQEEHAQKIDQLSRVGKVCVFVQNNSLDDTFPILLQSESDEHKNN